ncbi:ABC transporter permease [Arabiibacter massiliensis]|uniref:ABC transporter permease n=1 Tax=Arabiibacter massiliensis TaxID=1870985 RepID=UPI0009BB01DE|nr:ABC transporter permease [Arabiibacter massiliensis]
MQVFKTALRVVLTHPVYVVVYVGFLSMLGLFVAMGVTSGADAGRYEAAKAPFAVIDRDGSALSEHLAAFLGEHGDPVEVADDPFALQDAVATGQTRCVLIVPEGYEQAFFEAARSGGDLPAIEVAYSYGTMTGTLLDQQANQYLALVQAASALDADASVSDVLARADEAAAQSIEVETVQTKDGAIPADRFAFYLQWCAYTLTASIIVCVSLLMGAFNRTDVLRRTQVGPLSSVRLGLWKAAASFLVTVAVWAVTCTIGLAAFGYTLEGVPGGAVALMLAGAFALSLMPLAVGFLLGQLGVGEATANAVGNIGGMVMTFMGGAWISLDLLGAEIQTAAKFFPTYWYTQAITQSAHLTEVSWETAAPILGELGIVVLFAAVIFAVALAAGRVRMRSAEAGGNAAASMTGA